MKIYDCLIKSPLNGSRMVALLLLTLVNTRAVAAGTPSLPGGGSGRPPRAASAQLPPAEWMDALSSCTMDEGLVFLDQK